jgi:hypothetical protein
VFYQTIIRVSSSDDTKYLGSSEGDEIEVKGRFRLEQLEHDCKLTTLWQVAPVT